MYNNEQRNVHFQSIYYIYIVLDNNYHTLAYKNMSVIPLNIEYFIVQFMISPRSDSQKTIIFLY